MKICVHCQCDGCGGCGDETHIVELDKLTYENIFVHRKDLKVTSSKCANSNGLFPLYREIVRTENYTVWIRRQ